MMNIQFDGRTGKAERRNLMTPSSVVALVVRVELLMRPSGRKQPLLDNVYRLERNEDVCIRKNPPHGDRRVTQ